MYHVPTGLFLLISFVDSIRMETNISDDDDVDAELRKLGWHPLDLNTKQGYQRIRDFLLQGKNTELHQNRAEKMNSTDLVVEVCSFRTGAPDHRYYKTNNNAVPLDSIMGGGVPDFVNQTSSDMKKSAGIGDDLFSVTFALLAAEELNAMGVSFAAAEAKRQKEYPIGFDEVFPMFASGVIPVNSAGHGASFDSAVGPSLSRLRQRYPAGAFAYSPERRTVVATFGATLPSQSVLDSRDTRRAMTKYMAHAVLAPTGALLPGDDELVIHVRSGDVLKMHNEQWRAPPLPYAIYDAAIAEIQPKKIRIVTMPPPQDRHPAIYYLLNKYPGRVTVQHLSVREDLGTMSHAKHFLPDFSALSWFAMMLNKAPQTLFQPHFVGRDGTDYQPPESFGSDYGFVWPRDDGDVQVCSLDLTHVVSASSLEGKDYKSNKQDILDYMAAGAGQVKKTCWRRGEAV